jgi:alanine-synthesizing transaminase
MFSSRLPALLAPNALTRAIDRHRAAGRPLLDLTVTNPTDVGLTYPPDLLAPLADCEALHYRPEPFGLLSAREAIAAQYGSADARARAERIVLTASTSEAYALLFKLLCDPGDEVLVPQPSYPLFDLLTRLDDVAARPYQLTPHDAWSIDRATLEASSSNRTRAVLVVSPNNPTGSLLRASDREWLVSWCRSRRVALIVDEVFADYPLAPRADASTIAGESDVLTFRLGGLSKSAGLPQLKLGWMTIDGPDAWVSSARERLEVICDTYLSVSTPVQIAAPRLIQAGRLVRAAISERLRSNLSRLQRAVTDHPAISFRPPEAGWSAVLQVPATIPEDALVLRLLEEAGVLVHPGFFFDFPREAYLVLSLLPAAEEFEAALARLLPIASGALAS